MITAMDSLVAKATIDFHPRHYRIGPAPDEVVLYYVVSWGIFEGPGIHFSSVSDCGAEWCTMRGDGVISLDAKQVLRTPAGDLIYATFSGLYDVGEDGYVDALDDELTSTARAALAIRFYTAAKEHRWLNRAQLIGVGQRDFASHALDLRIFSVD